MNSKKSISTNVLMFFLILFSVSIINAQKYVVKNGTAFFKAKISFNSYKGTSNQLKGYIDFKTRDIEFTVPAKSIFTGIKKRDQHMYELIKANEFKEVSFKGKLIDDFDLNKNKKQILNIKGLFTLAGVSKEITLNIELTPEQKGLKLNATWSLLITDYNLKRPTKVFFKVNDKHKMGVDALLVKE